MRRVSLVVVVATAGFAACTPVKIKSPESAAAELQRAQEIVFGFELKPECKLERSKDGLAAGAVPKDSDWGPFDSQSVANRVFKVVDHKTLLPKVGLTKERIAVALELTNERDGGTYWVRNVPADSSEDATKDWACAFDREVVIGSMPKLQAPVVELAFSSNQCTTITPVFGDVNDLTFSPYTVTGRTLFSTDRGPVVGVRLEAEGGDKALTVPARVLDQCFVAADRPPPPPQEAVDFVGWLRSPETLTTPGVSIDTAQMLTGVKLDRCMRDGTGLTTHWECRMPILAIAPAKEAGPFGPPLIRVERSRVVDALHFYAKRLISAADVVTVNAVVRMHGVSAITKAFNAELEKAVLDPEAKLRRAGNGFRLLRGSDVSAGIPATHEINLDVSAEVPQATATMEQRVHKYSRGQKTINNPKYADAQTAVATKTQELSSAKQALDNAQALAKQAGDAAGKACGDAASKAGDNLPFGLGAFAGSVASSACNAGAQKVVAGAEQADFDRKTKELSDAQSVLDSTPRTITVDDEATYPFEAKVYKRSGDATAQVTVATSGGQKELVTSVTFHFEASDDEYAASPEHQLQAKAAKMPSDDDVYRQLAKALIARVDEAIIKWAAQRQVGGDIGDLQPGTRSWMVAVARHAASDRPVKLLSDLLETRPEELEKPVLEYPVKMPQALENRCFTFATIPLTNGADVNMYLMRKGDGSPTTYARDTRPGGDSSFELCDMPAGDYTVRVSFGAKKISTGGVLIAMFDSTPGAVTNADTVAASKGLPTKPRKGEELALNGEGIVQYVGVNNRVVTGKTGDRDGDQIPDDEDRCPYDPETYNKYLDTDGCPDVVPAGWDAGAQ